MTRSQVRYLNTILTVVAVLLGVLVWTQVSSRPMLAQEADAQSRSGRHTADVGIPNAAQQRDKMVKSIEQMTKTVNSLSKDIEKGKIKVEVTNLDEIEINVR